MMKKANPDAFIEMDGGIGMNNINSVKEAGVSVFVCGNSVFGSDNPVQTIEEMKKIINS
jgi:ribulose-phosphate 3-epimerase